MRRLPLLLVFSSYMLAGWLFPSGTRADDLRDLDGREAPFLPGVGPRTEPTLQTTIPVPVPPDENPVRFSFEIGRQARITFRRPPEDRLPPHRTGLPGGDSRRFTARLTFSF